MYTNEKIQELISPYGFLLEEYKSTKNIIAKDSEGYKYKITLSNLLDGKIPHKIMKNPYATDNLRLYLSIHYPRYIWLDDEYHGCKEKYHFICLNHIEKGIQINSFDNIMNNHHVCKYCSYEKMRDSRMVSEDVAIELCDERNVIYVGRYTKNHETYIQYKCQHHLEKGIQEMSLSHFRMSKMPCHYCTMSSGEHIIQEFLKRNGICYEYQKAFEDCRDIGRLRFDFYLPSYNIIIEFDGAQHFIPVNFNGDIDGGASIFLKTKRRDKIKNEYCINHNIELIRIPYWQYNDINEILTNKLLMCRNIESSETAG